MRRREFISTRPPAFATSGLAVYVAGLESPKGGPPAVLAAPRRFNHKSWRCLEGRRAQMAASPLRAIAGRVLKRGQWEWRGPHYGDIG